MKKFFLFLVFLLFLSSLVSANFKDESLFCDSAFDREVFLVSDKYWQEVVQLTPVVFDNDGAIRHPMLVFHEEENSFDLDSVIHFIQKYKPSYGNFRVSLIYDSSLECSNPDNPPLGRDKVFCDLINVLRIKPPFGAGLSDAGDIQLVFPSRLTDYWSEIDTVVLVENNYELALTASAFAAKNNYPLFVNSIPENFYLENVEVILVGNIGCPVLSCDKFYSDLDSLRSEMFSSPPEGVIVVNPNDLDSDYADFEPLQPDKSPNKVFNLYYKQSLLAGLLSAARNELIMFLPLEQSSETEDCTGNITVNAFNARHQILDELDELSVSYFNGNWPEFFTILASPQLLPDSVCAGEKNNDRVRHQFDSFYFNKNPFKGDSLSASMAVDSSNNIVLAYSNVKANLITQFGTENVYFTKLDSSGVRVEGFEDKLIGFSDGQVSNAFVLVDSSDNSIVFWEDSADNKTHVSLVDSSGNFLPESTLLLDGKNVNAVINEKNEIFTVFLSQDSKNLSISKLVVKDNVITEEFSNTLLGSAFNLSHLFLSFSSVDSEKLGLSFFIESNQATMSFVWVNSDGTLIDEAEDNWPLTVSTDAVPNPHNFLLDSADNIYFVFVSGDKLFFKSFDYSGNLIEGKEKGITVNGVPAFVKTVFKNDNELSVFWSSKSTSEPEINYFELILSDLSIPEESIKVIGSGFNPLVLPNENKLFLLWFNLVNRGNKEQVFLENDLFFSYNNLDGAGWHNSEFSLSVSLDSETGAKWGRIYSLTSSDVSSYVNFSLFYNKFTSSWSSASIAHSFPLTKTNAIKIADGREEACFIGEPGLDPEIEIGEEFKGYCEPELYPTDVQLSSKRLITFGDHGSEIKWVNSLEIREPMLNEGITWFDTSFIAANACLTSHFDFESKVTRYNVAPNMLRRGAIAYLGATGITYYFPIEYDDDHWFENGPEVKAANYLFELGYSGTIELGKLNRQLYVDSLNNPVSNYAAIASIYTLLGDPMLKLKGY
ncbi:MAG: C25 family cysteine peptidase [archaeon]